MLQITIAKEHTIKNEAVRRFLEWMNQKQGKLSCTFVFVVPDTSICDWNVCQQLVSVGGGKMSDSSRQVAIRQYVIGVSIVSMVV